MRGSNDFYGQIPLFSLTVTECDMSNAGFLCSREGEGPCSSSVGVCNQDCLVMAHWFPNLYDGVVCCFSDGITCSNSRITRMYLSTDF